MNQQIKKIPLDCFNLIKKPSINDFEYISEWLTDAYNNHKELKGYALCHNLKGFIHDAFVEHTVFTIRYKGKSVAFLIFSPPREDCLRIIIRAVCVKPVFLRMGLATHLHKKTIEYYQKQGVLVAELWNVCRESYQLGKSMGFVKIIENIKSNEMSMFKILINTRKQNRNAKIRFVVWGSSYADTNTKAIYSWSLNFQRDKKPIIRSIDFEWTVGIIKDNEVVDYGIAKHFWDIFPIGGNYIYIDEDKAKRILKSIER